MIALGLIFILIGWLVGLGLLTSIGLILVVIGLILMLLGATGRPIGGRPFWW